MKGVGEARGARGQLMKCNSVEETYDILTWHMEWCLKIDSSLRKGTHLVNVIGDERWMMKRL